MGNAGEALAARSEGFLLYIACMYNEEPAAGTVSRCSEKKGRGLGSVRGSMEAIHRDCSGGGSAGGVDMDGASTGGRWRTQRCYYLGDGNRRIRDRSHAAATGMEEDTREMENREDVIVMTRRQQVELQHSRGKPAELHLKDPGRLAVLLSHFPTDSPCILDAFILCVTLKSIFYRDVIFEELRSRVFLMPMGRMIAHCDNHLHNIPNRRKDFNWIPPTVLKVRKKKRRKNHRNAQRVIMRNSIVLRASLSDLLKLPRGEVCIVMMRHSMRPFSYLLERGPWESATERWTHGDVGDEEDFRIESYHMPILVTIKNVFISSRGQVYGEDIGLIWYKGLCPRFLPKNMLPQAAQSYNKIFVISQDTGNYVYHALTEDYPRVAAYYQELLKDDSIMIHVVEEHRDMLSKLFALLGIHSRRLIHGNAFGGTVFWPESSYECVLGSRWHVRKMRSITRLTLEKKYPTIFVQGSLSPPPLFQHVFSDHQAADVKSNAPIRWPANPNRPPTQPGLVISRTKRRRVRNEADIIRMLYEWYPTYSFEVFSDNPIPSIEETYYLFYYARIIIAPHGAGLANMIVSPGAGVPLVQNSEQAKLIEFRGSSPAPCFEHLAASLGVEYFRLHPKKNHGLFGDMTVDLVSLRDLLVHAIGPPPG
ncbi:hypothetical protein CBR_g22206 [Chara braunii]|uniref:Glycosyltransferase 61 catalytic domain-containing protein n=1 Tax=Chara braunii TaxID=69332 RepID=A0A388L2H0_CHABU|nr:hypothetical protein CBR_g22206 [Chara braunii]|eukprot:GBG76458.1 hypothetical protein CBR_g22206 [Chara braunii]